MARKSDLLKTEAGAGLILGLAALAGLIAANSPLSGAYFGLLHHEVPVRIGAWAETHDVLDWIKEGLLAVFFFVVGLEIKFEVMKGELSSPKRLALPLLSAAGGMVVPAAIYLAVNAGGGHPQGWPIPVATDIVFALAALAAVGPRAPATLRVFLLALAVVDDLGAVLLIAVLFSGELDLAMIGGALAVLAAMALLSFWKRAHAILYVLGAVAVWAFTLKSGIATSVGAVAAALTIPLAQPRPGQHGLAHEMTDALRPYVSFVILPLFAFAASGFSFAALGLADLLSPVAIGVFAGLVIGKPIGIFGASWLAVRLNLAHRPTGANWTQLFGAALLCGVGFTMSLYLAGLAFDEGGPLSAAARLGVMSGSLAATAAGVLLLLRSGAPRASARLP
jgi:NhaA family Na+:H+ antiporter